jgi:hypothetical protein
LLSLECQLDEDLLQLFIDVVDAELSVSGRLLISPTYLLEAVVLEDFETALKS